MNRSPRGIRDLSNETLSEIALLLPPPWMLNLALCSSVALSEPVLRVLWRHLPSPIPALCLIAGFHTDDQTGEWKLPRKLDLNRFKYYSEFVQTCLFPCATIGIMTLQRIFEAGGILFPGLRECHFRDDYDEFEFSMDTRCILTLLSTRIEVASIHLPLVPTSFHPLFPSSLLTLTLSGAVYPADISSLTSCLNLRELIIAPDDDFQLGTVSAAVLDIASNMPSLTTLSLRVKGRPHMFRKITGITSLTLCGEPTDIECVLVCFFGLQDLTLDFKHRLEVQQEACASCFSHVGRHSARSLTKLKFTSNWTSGPDGFPLSTALQLLYNNVESLKYLTISLNDDGWLPNFIGTTDIGAMSRRWPHMEELHLNVCVASAALLVLARLSRLRTISVRFGNTCLQIPSIIPFDQSDPSVVNYVRTLFSERRRILSDGTQTLVRLDPDVLENIFGFLGPSELHPLLLVSRLVYYLSRKFLWKALPSLIPLVKLLPGTVIKRITVYHWVPPITHKDFSAFDSHARLVESVAQDILSCPIHHQSIGEQVFEILQSLRPGHILLPNLKVLRYFRPILPSVTYALPFISSSLRSLSLDLKDNCTNGLLNSVFALSPRITEIRLSGLLTHSLLASLRSFADLSVLSLQFNEKYYNENLPHQNVGRVPQIVSQALSVAFEAIKGIKTLTTLGYNIPFEESSIPIPDNSWSRNVTSLRLDAPSSAMLHQLPAFTGLINVSLHLYSTTQSLSLSGDPLELCCKCLATHTRESLRVISITCGEILLRPVFDHVQPLMAISGIQAFALRLQKYVLYSDQPYVRHQDASQIAFHWPGLEELILTGRDNIIQSPPSIHDILPLSRLTVLKILQIQGLPLTVYPFSQGINSLFSGPNYRSDGFSSSHQLHDVLARTP